MISRPLCHASEYQAVTVTTCTIRSKSARPDQCFGQGGNGIRLNHQIEEDGPTVFRYARKLGLEGIVSKAEDSLPQWPIARLAQDEEPERARGATGKPRRIGAESGGDNAV
jgi:hypothetical protein